MPLNCGVGEDSRVPCKDIKLVSPKGNQSWITGRTDTEVEAPILWLPDEDSQLIRKGPDAGKDWRQEEKGITKDEMGDVITNSMDVNLSKLQEMVKDREAWCTTVHGIEESKMAVQL